MKRFALTLLTGIGALAIAHGAFAAEIYVSHDQVRQAQQALRQEGYGVATTGTVNIQTTNALRQYQSDNRLVPTGALDAPTLASLHVEDPASATREQNEMKAARGAASNGPLDNNMGTGQANTNSPGY